MYNVARLINWYYYIQQNNFLFVIFNKITIFFILETIDLKKGNMKGIWSIGNKIIIKIFCQKHTNLFRTIDLRKCIGNKITIKIF